MKDPEFKHMMRHRFMNSDGFTYVYGAIKDGSSVKLANATTKRCIRNDKRSVKNKVMKRLMNEYYSGD